MESEKLVPNKRYRNVTVDGCKFDWVRLVQKPVQFVQTAAGKKVKCSIKILIVMFCLLIGASGCDLLTGMGIGVGASETLTYIEEGLEVKRIELAKQYDIAIERMRATNDPNKLNILREDVQQIQIAQIANMGASTVLKELKYPEGELSDQPYLNLLHGVIPLALGYAGIEIRKRLMSEKKRRADKQGRELAMRELAAMKDSDVTAPIVKELMYRDIAKARVGSI